ncbi:MAG: replicative DNA helicase [Luteibacter sp.]|uniref:replicative DNA helicase n=1 Tax=Rhodanobacteraceae TaxID=1775411 RepID=UPI00056CC181|nr:MULTISPECIES: replicative DNA helicase [Rhodanobacteraceae]MDQ7995974.1 replicative DNA helicase [Luteibacter sp.]MDQ8048739.1 replicative DNA helicase [Luteibacter sp.]MDR6644020.1 replicative DNA helicase [Luteibacter sp. 1214]SDF19639.1 primary replicative DNA helicase [Dyella sp. 333MFSha]SKB80986.1 primary replicative DNA helicase [Luteibacter sp. 22Crub2.1]
MSFNPERGERGERGDRKRRREREPSAFESLRIPPHSIEAEQAVLGGLMLSPDSLDKVADKLTDDDFYRKDHRLIWRAINELANKGMPCDAITLGDWFVANEMAEMVGGASYLMELANSTPSAANIAAYGDIVREKSVLRMLIDAGTSITEDGFRPEGKSVQEVMELAEQRVFRIAESGARGKKDIVSVREAVGEAFRMLTERYEKRGQLTGLSTGFTDLDELTSGLQPSDLVIIAARPSMGKTAFALNLAEAAAMRGKKAVAVFSMEMSASQLAFRLISSLGRVHAQHLRNGDLAEEDWPRVTSAITMLSDAKIFIDDTPAMSPVEMRSRSRRLQREHGLGLIVIDYLQLMQVPGNSENRATEISEISRGLKALAKELNVPVIALSQLNRSLEQRADKRPMMSDLRESGAIEQDADVIMFIYRDEYYNKESPDKGLAEIIIGKQRNGPTDTVKLAFLGHYTKFENWTPESYVGSFD